MKKVIICNLIIVYGYTFAEEKAMLKAFEKFGYTLVKTKNDKIILEIQGEKRAFYIVGENSYTTNRNRMSMILKKYRKDSEAVLVCKGYDMNIFNVIKKENDVEISLIKDQILKLSNIGYRYVIFCKKFLSEEETTTFMIKYKLAENYALEREFLFENV